MSGRLRLAAVASASALLLAACASTPPDARSGARGDPGKPSSGARRGGYYLDDGPGSNPPADIAAIPDASPRPEPLLPRANRPYVVFGKQYTPMTAMAPYRERGLASWYGRKYHGQRTSSGEVYDMYGMTAAHPTLPIPSFARVTSVRDGRSVVVRVNDRGPFLYDRVIDLSYTAAAKLGYVGKGSVEVDVELITRFDDAGIEARGSAAPATEALVRKTEVAAPPARATVALSPPLATTTQSVAAVTATTAATAVTATTAATAVTATTAATPAATTAATAASSAPALSAADAPTGREDGLRVETTVGGTPVGTARASVASAPATPDAPTPAGAGSAPAPGRAAPPDRLQRETVLVAPAGSSVGGTAAAESGHYLQLAAFATRENAESSRDRLSRELDWLADRLHVRQEGALFKVHAGPYRQRDEAMAVADRIRQATAFRPFPVSR